MILKSYLIVLGVMSLVSFACFGIDKLRSKKEGKGRIPEIFLLSLSGFGGGLGALAAMYLFRHKTIFKTKYHFILSVWLGAIMQVALAGYIALKVL